MKSNPNFGRPVKFKVYEIVEPANTEPGAYRPAKRDWVDYDGIFHEYGISESDNISANSIAICELPDGRVMAPYVEHIQFMDKADTEDHPNNIHGH